MKRGHFYHRIITAKATALLSTPVAHFLRTKKCFLPIEETLDSRTQRGKRNNVRPLVLGVCLPG